MLTDDLAAQQAVEQLGIRPVGSLGIVARGFRLGMVTMEQAEALLWGLYRVSSLFVTAVIVELALENYAKVNLGLCEQGTSAQTRACASQFRMSQSTNGFHARLRWPLHLQIIFGLLMNCF